MGHSHTGFRGLDGAIGGYVGVTGKGGKPFLYVKVDSHPEKEGEHDD